MSRPLSTSISHFPSSSFLRPVFGLFPAHFVPLARSATYFLYTVSSAYQYHALFLFFLLFPPFLSRSFQNGFFLFVFFKFPGSDMCNCRAELWSLKWIKGNGHQWWYLAVGLVSKKFLLGHSASCYWQLCLIFTFKPMLLAMELYLCRVCIKIGDYTGIFSV